MRLRRPNRLVSNLLQTLNLSLFFISVQKTRKGVMGLIKQVIGVSLVCWPVAVEALLNLLDSFGQLQNLIASISYRMKFSCHGFCCYCSLQFSDSDILPSLSDISILSEGSDFSWSSSFLFCFSLSDIFRLSFTEVMQHILEIQSGP